MLTFVGVSLHRQLKEIIYDKQEVQRHEKIHQAIKKK
jgi:hypothetical protein